MDNVKWMAANQNIYRHDDSFLKNGYIDWRQRNSVEVGDIIYLYYSDLKTGSDKISLIGKKCIVEKTNIPYSEKTNDDEFWTESEEPAEYYFRLRPLRDLKEFEITWDLIHILGVTQAPRGVSRVPRIVYEYIQSFEDSVSAESCIEGLEEGEMKQSVVNRYERDPVLRRECIRIQGCYCHICGFDFKKFYGDAGDGFIEVHHIVPLGVRKAKHHVDPSKDLIPLCSNCHSIIHRSGYSVDQLRSMVNQRRNEFP